MHNEVYQSQEGSSQHESAEKDHEMVQQQLNNLIANANQLLEQCKCGSPKLTEAWVQSKMTLANDYVDTVHAYVVNGGDASGLHMLLGLCGQKTSPLPQDDRLTGRCRTRIGP